MFPDHQVPRRRPPAGGRRQRPMARRQDSRREGGLAGRRNRRPQARQDPRRADRVRDSPLWRRSRGRGTVAAVLAGGEAATNSESSSPSYWWHRRSFLTPRRKTGRSFSVPPFRGRRDICIGKAVRKDRGNSCRDCLNSSWRIGASMVRRTPCLPGCKPHWKEPGLGKGWWRCRWLRARRRSWLSDSLRIRPYKVPGRRIARRGCVRPLGRVPDRSAVFRTRTAMPAMIATVIRNSVRVKPAGCRR